MADPDPTLALATTDQLVAELGRRFPEHIFCGRGVSRSEAGREGWSIHWLGDPDVRLGMVQRLAMAVRMELRASLLGAGWNTQEMDEPEDQ